mgnify:CR=1 FL=1
MGIAGRNVPSIKPITIMYTDKINPNHPEGRLLISSSGFQLKDQSLPISDIPLCNKAQLLFKHLEDNNFETSTKERMKKAYESICSRKSFRSIERYSEILRQRPSEQKFLSWWLLFDFYDMMPDGTRVNSNSAYYRLGPYYQNLIDRCMKAGIENGTRKITVSIEASMIAPFFEYLEHNSIHTLSSLTEKAVRNYVKSGRCKPTGLYRMSLFMRRYAEKVQDTGVLSVLHFFPKERRERRIYKAFTHNERNTVEQFILSADCPLSKRDRAVVALLLYTGMRSCDVRDLKLTDIDWEKSTVKFRQGKTLGDVILPLRPVIGNLIYEYLTEERPECDRDRIFVSLRPHSGKYTGPSISAVVNRTYDLCGIRQNGIRKGPHLLRHSLADEMVNRGNDVTMVAKTLGHISPDTSLGYMSSNIEQLRACALSIEDYPVTHKLYCHE